MKYRTFIQRNAEKIIFLHIMVIAGMITALVVWKSGISAEAPQQQHLSDEVLRIHILANSDSREDQLLKLKVRDGVLEYLEQEMPDCESADATAEWVRKHTDELEKEARDILE